MVPDPAPEPEGGPRNLLEATLDAIEAQLTALARGDHAHPSLDVSIGGPTGTALRRIRETLVARPSDPRRIDPMTGVLDRPAGIATIEAAVEGSRRASSDLAVLLVDLDGLRAVNERHGHPVGDRVLAEAAARLETMLRPSDVVARFDGDEFVVVMGDLGDVTEAVRLGGRIVEQLRQTYVVGDLELSLWASVGVAWSPGGEIPTTDLLSHAEIALFRAKAAGAGGTELFDEHLHRAVHGRPGIARGLDAAISDGELELWYQPIIDTATSDVWGMESLVRWRLPEGRLLPPEQFVPIAERSDLILDMDRHLIRRAAAELASWRDETMARLHLTVNVSGRHLVVGQLDRDVEEALEDAGLAGHRLIVEINESQLMDVGDRALPALERLRALGVGVAIDNFGTGYASVVQLKHLPLTHLKIDGALVGSPTGIDRDILELIARLGTRLGVALIAQGVERPDSLELIEALGFSHAQGYLLGAPMPSKDLWSWLRLRATQRPEYAVSGPG